VTRIAALARWIPRSLREFAAGALGRSGAFQSSSDRFRKASAAFLDPDALPHEYFFTRLLFTPQMFASAAGREFSSWDSLPWWRWLSDSARQTRSMDRFTQISWLELRSYLLNTLLRDTDSMSMANSLEVRVPFLDAPLVEYVLSLPESAKLGSSRPKELLIAALGDLLPPEVVAQKKRTFTFPWEEWLRASLGERVAAGLADWSPALESHLGKGFALGVWRDFQNGRTTWSRPWSLYVLNEWVKRNVSEDRARTADFPRTAAVSIS